MTERIVRQDTPRGLGKREKPLREERVRQTVYVDEGQLVLLQERTRRRRTSMSATIGELIAPVINNINNASPEEQIQLLSQSRERILKKYEDYEAVYIARTKRGGPHPFMGIHCLFPRHLVDKAAKYASQINASVEDFLSDLLAGTLPQLNKYSNPK